MPQVTTFKINKRQLRSVAGFITLICLLAFASFAASVDDYRKRVDSAGTVVNGLSENLDSPGSDLERSLITEIESDLPATETIEWLGGYVETDNQWLRTRFGEFAAEPDANKRLAILDGITERLNGILASVEDLNRQVSSQNSKDQNKQKLSEILLREEYQKPTEQGKSLFQKWLDSFLDWIAKMFPKPDISSGTPSDFSSLKFGLQILIYAFVIALVGFLVYKFAPFLMRKAAGKAKKGKRERVILGERIADDETASDLFSEAERLAREGNLRGAIRKGYIALLCELSDRHIVRLARHKTNRDYLRDVRKNDHLLKNMQGLTGSFERNWYGLRAVDLADWEEFRSGYKQALDAARTGK